MKWGIAMENKVLEAGIGKWEDRRDLKNLMGRYMYSLLYYRHANLLSQFWSERDDICLGFNNGYYKGREAIEEYYRACHDWTVFQGKLMQKYFPETLGEKTEEELFGVGPLELKPMSMPVIAIAEDGETAKGMWYSRGSYAKITKSGPTAYWTWGVFCVDFVREGGEWKIWHMLNVEDINHIAGQNWAAPEEPFADEPGFEEAEEFSLPEPNVPQINRSLYTPDRPFTRLPELPVAYRTFAETFSYGI